MISGQECLAGLLEAVAWERIENDGKEERLLQPIRKILVKGSADGVFRRCDKPVLVVAGEAADAVASVKPQRYRLRQDQVPTGGAT
ncbi:MAG: hypothetical protein WBI41_08245 [Azovibrio sp.]|uniref:hypothetical protein n=1 Tax=Azovibrio sp. TaxID=1872673 RepID=UPI003C75F31C